jgi:hypothetical protein
MADNPNPLMMIGDIDAAAAANAELFQAHVKAGMPPTAVAVMIGTLLGTLVAQADQGDQT